MSNRIFRQGDIIKNLWMGDTNPLQTCLYIQHPRGFLVGVYNTDKLYMTPVDAKFKKRMELDEEHYVKVGHCEIEGMLRNLLNNYKG